MSVLTPATQVPWAVLSPFRMRPGLARLATAHGAPEAPPPLFVRDPQAAAYAECKRVSNAKAKAVFGWRPEFATYREGLGDCLGKTAGQ